MKKETRNIIKYQSYPVQYRVFKTKENQWNWSANHPYMVDNVTEQQIQVTERLVKGPAAYTRKSDAKRGLIRFLRRSVISA